MDGRGWACIVLALLIVERLTELGIARRNEAWMRSRGGRELGCGFTRLIVAFHALWFLAFTLEAIHRAAVPIAPPTWIFAAVLFLQAGRYWCIVSLGRFWNTKVIVLPGASVVRRGPYRWLSHPNYLVVGVELALVPILFGCWWTAAVFGSANVWVLGRRIGQEEAALAAHTDFEGTKKGD